MSSDGEIGSGWVTSTPDGSDGAGPRGGCCKRRRHLLRGVRPGRCARSGALSGPAAPCFDRLRQRGLGQPGQLDDGFDPLAQLGSQRLRPEPHARGRFARRYNRTCTAPIVSAVSSSAGIRAENSKAARSVKWCPRWSGGPSRFGKERWVARGHRVDACSVQGGRCRERTIHEVAVEHGQAVTADLDPQPHVLLGRPSGSVAERGFCARCSPSGWWPRAASASPAFSSMFSAAALACRPPLPSAG